MREAINEQVMYLMMAREYVNEEVTRDLGCQTLLLQTLGSRYAIGICRQHFEDVYADNTLY